MRVLQTTSGAWARRRLQAITRQVVATEAELSPPGSGKARGEIISPLPTVAAGNPVATESVRIVAEALGVTAERLMNTDLREWIRNPPPGLQGLISGESVPAWARRVTWMNRGSKDLRELIEQNKGSANGARVAVIGIAISGVQAMKACLAEGIEPVGFESDADIGGFWRFKDDVVHPSVYRSVHIDSDRDLNSFGDFPWSADTPMLIHNTELTNYLRLNYKEFGLNERTKLNCTVTFVTPAEGTKGKFGTDAWEVHYVQADPATGRTTPAVEVFDGVLICSGRHGGGGFIPKFPNQEKFKGVILHSSQYKYPEKHGLVGKNVAVVGIGNSGADIVTEFGMMNGGGMRTGNGVVVNENRAQTYLVARSGGWVMKAAHMDEFSGVTACDAVAEGAIGSRMPWWVATNAVEQMTADGTPGISVAGQSQLNRHGMTPTHRKLQQHPVLSGLAGQVWLGDQMDKGWIKMKRGINMEKGFAEDGTGIWLNDSSGNPEPAPTECAGIIFATGYRQQAGFVDPKVVDMRFEREHNDVTLYKGMLPVTDKYRGLGFVNFIQSLTFGCAEIQSRWLTRVFKGLIPIPSAEEQQRDLEDTRNTLTSQYIDRSQLRINYPGTYYDALAEDCGCKPTFYRLLTERPTALWHALFSQGPFAGSAGQMPNRLTGPGRLEDAERYIEDHYHSRHFGTYKEAGGGYDYCDKAGQPKNGDGLGPLNRRDPSWTTNQMQTWKQMLSGLEDMEKTEGVVVGPWDRTQPFGAQLAQNLKYAKEDMEQRGIHHSLAMGEDAKDGYLEKGGERVFAFANRATGEKGLKSIPQRPA